MIIKAFKTVSYLNDLRQCTFVFINGSTESFWFGFGLDFFSAKFDVYYVATHIKKMRRVRPHMSKSVLDRCDLTEFV